MDIALQILGTGEHIPSRRVDSEEFDRRWSQEPGWTYRQTGVRSRAFLGADENAITMGAEAARCALAAASVEYRELDAIISVGSVPYQPIPCTAAFLQQALGLGDSGIPAFDINSTCLGFIVALDLVAQAIAMHRYRTVLIIASEPASVALDWDDTSTAGLFGDGAGAVVVGVPRRNGPALRASHIQTFSSGARLCQIRAGGSGRYARGRPEEPLSGTAFEMKGRATYRLAAERMPPFVRTLLDRASVGTEEIDSWIPHQASGHAIAHLQNAMSLSPERFIVTLETTGNQVSASLPIALHRGIASNRIRPGDLVAFLGAGAGMSFGGAVLSF
jgi:3-oxoacyl-[acyl-carrier-protein] synthase-3